MLAQRPQLEQTFMCGSCLFVLHHRSLQEGLASELAARMNAMNNATDNAKELKKVRRMIQLPLLNSSGFTHTWHHRL
jgi:hypothetical protein